MSSDQKFTNIASTGQVKTISGGSVNIGPCRITYIQGNGVASSTLVLETFHLVVQVLKFSKLILEQKV